LPECYAFFIVLNIVDPAWSKSRPDKTVACTAQQKLKIAAIDIDPQGSAYRWNESRPASTFIDEVAQLLCRLEFVEGGVARSLHREFRRVFFSFAPLVGYQLSRGGQDSFRNG
jgi:hypothetical protein